MTPNEIGDQLSTITPISPGEKPASSTVFLSELLNLVYFPFFFYYTILVHLLFFFFELLALGRILATGGISQSFPNYFSFLVGYRAINLFVRCEPRTY